MHNYQELYFLINLFVRMTQYMLV